MLQITPENWRDAARDLLWDANEGELEASTEGVRGPWRETVLEIAEEELDAEILLLIESVEAMAAKYAEIRANGAFAPWRDGGGHLWKLLDVATKDIERRRAQRKEPPMRSTGQAMDMVTLARPWRAA